MIVGVAIMQGNIICSLPKPNRHHHIIQGLAQAGMPIPIIGKQGFINSDGQFLNRIEAKQKAFDYDQIQSLNTGHNELYSEDLW
jgi:hypothetical protein